ncbi:hypothetical protein D3C86_1918480 [compost metagenome]
MLRETVKAPSFFITSIVAMNAKEVQQIPKNKSHPRSPAVIWNKFPFIFPVNKSTTERKTSPIPISCKVMDDEGTSSASLALNTEKNAAHNAETSPRPSARYCVSSKSEETK